MRARPLFFPVIAMMMGMCVGGLLKIEGLFFGMIMTMLLLNILIAWRYFLYRQFFLLLASFCFGIIWMGVAFILPQEHMSKKYEEFRSKIVLCQGRIVSNIEEGMFNQANNKKFVFDLTHIQMNQRWVPVTGKVLVTSFSPVVLRYGDQLLLEGKIFYPFERKGLKTSYRQYLKYRDIYFSMSIKKNARVVVMGTNPSFSLWKFSLQTAQHMKQHISSFFSKEESAILYALVLGDQKQVSKMIRDLFAKTGAAHLLAVSGFNVGIVAMGAMLILKMFSFPWRLRFLLAIAIVIFYALLTGMMAAVVRAMLMGSVFLAGYLFEREVDIFNSLALSACLILIVSPFQIFDIGFQLSFSCVLAILICSSLWPVQQGCSKINRFMIEAIGMTVASTIGSLGISAYYFGYISPISLLSNIVLVPMIAFITVLGVCFFFLFWWPFVAGLFVICIKVMIHGALMVVYFFSLVPGGSYEIKEISLWKVIVFYFCVGLLMMVLLIRKKVQQS